METYFHEYVMPLFHLAMEMSDFGILADKDVLAKFKSSMERGIALKSERFESLTLYQKEIKRKAKKYQDLPPEYEMVGVNPRSYKQLKELLYTTWGLPKQYNQEGGITTDKKAIETLVKRYGKEYPALRLLGSIRMVEKMYSTYACVVLSEAGRIHTTYFITGTETGRFSSKKDEDDEGLNLQNVPPWFRTAFLPDPGKILLEGDLSQAEARIVAYIAGEEDMIKVFNDPTKSIHKLNVSKIFGIPEDKVVKDSRPTQPYGMAKKCTHGWDYLLGDLHASKITGKPVKEMARHREAYFRAYPNILRWHDVVKDLSYTSKTLNTPFGRSRTFFGRPPKRVEGGEIQPNLDTVRKMVAWGPQSTCTEYLKRGMLRARGLMFDSFAKRYVETLPKLRDGMQFLMDNHDGFLLQCWPNQLEEAKEIMEKCTCIPLPVTDILGKTRELTIPMEFKKGYRWGNYMEDFK